MDDAGAPGREPGRPREPRPEVAASIFGDRLALAERYAELLITTGVVRGLIGPREPERIWSRHLLNCAVVAELFAPGQRVVDVGSGAGLPGLVLAITRPDLHIDLVEPLQRRADFLTEAVADLGLVDQVRVVRGRAEELAVRATVGGADWVTSRAVAPLDRLVGWCLPLLRAEGRLAMIKGTSAETELTEHRQAIGRLGGINPQVVMCGTRTVDPAVAVITVGVAPRRVARPSGARGKRERTSKGKR